MTFFGGSFRLWVSIVCSISCCGGIGYGQTKADVAHKRNFFERFVRPVLVEKCVDCHGPDEQEADFRLDSAGELFQGGASGRVVVPGNADASRLIQLVRGKDGQQMPPDTKLDATMITRLEKWVNDGAIWPGYDGKPLPLTEPLPATKFTDEQKAFWSLQPLKKITPPDVRDEAWLGNDVDRFILAELEANDIRPAAMAERRTLMRRITYDINGMPPSPQQLNDFINDRSDNAYQKLVDRLLRSPHYGERWGKHWLDVVRYAESAAHDGNNAYLHAWRYRDYVIQSFNDDKPFDQFVREQLAGDLLPKTGDAKTDYEQIVATGFLQVGTKPVVMRDKKQMLLDIADEQLHTTGVSFLGLTIGCARCHDHKFDPIPTADYYSLAGIFTSTHIMADQVADSKWLEYELPDPQGDPVKVMAVRDLASPNDLAIHRRGNYRTLGPIVPRRFLQVFSDGDRSEVPAGRSGRLELANWIVNDARALTARVITNRIWQQHFGRGLVASSGDFGFQGERPSHPELLDWLSQKLIDNHWSLKSIHRLILMSSTYRQAHRLNEIAKKADPENRLLWRRPRRRLDAEQFRDAVLAISEQIDLTMGGSEFDEGYGAVDANRELFTVDIPDPEKFRPFRLPLRTVYLPVIRNVTPEILRLFDTANSHESTSSRSETTVAPQALFLMNSRFIREASLAFANRLLSDVTPGPSDRDKRIQLAFQLAFGRKPTSSEIDDAHDFLGNVEANLDPTLLESASNAIAPAMNTLRTDRYVRLIEKESSLRFYQRFHHFEFNGTDQRIDISAKQLNQIQNEISMEYWVKPKRVGLGSVIGRDGATARYWKSGVFQGRVDGRDTNVVFHEFFPSGQGGFRKQDRLEFEAPVGKWTHVVFGMGSNQRRLYVNSKLVDQIKVSGAIPTGAQPVSIGGRATDSEWFQGTIDHVAIYESMLHESTVAKHYKTLLGQQHRLEFTRTNEHHVWAAFCQALFSMNEFIYLE